jgi:hypothetical protein
LLFKLRTALFAVFGGLALLRFFQSCTCTNKTEKRTFDRPFQFVPGRTPYKTWPIEHAEPAVGSSPQYYSRRSTGTVPASHTNVSAANGMARHKRNGHSIRFLHIRATVELLTYTYNGLSKESRGSPAARHCFGAIHWSIHAAVPFEFRFIRGVEVVGQVKSGT